MRKILSITLVIMVMAMMSAYAGEKAWFDMENCAFCKHLGTDPELLPNLGWEHHKISNGVVTVTTVPKSFTDSFNKVREAMEIEGKKMESGEMVPMCGMCTAMGGLMMKGAKYEEIKTHHGYVALMTSDNAELVKEIHAWTDRTNDELKKAEAEMMEQMKSHEGHGHE